MSDHTWDDQQGDETNQHMAYDESAYYEEQYSDQYDGGLFAAAAEAGPPPRTSGRLFWGLLIGGSAFVLIVAAALALLVFYIVPNQKAQAAAEAAMQAASQAFDLASTNYTQAQSDLQKALTTAQGITDTVTIDDVADETTIENLDAQVSAATALVVAVPAKADDTDTINQQAADLTTNTQKTSDATDALTQAIAAVQSSRIDLAVANLTTVINSAQKTYDASGWLGATKERSALQAQLDAANQAVINPSLLGVSTDDVIQALQSTQDAVSAAVKDLKTAQTKAKNATYTYTLKSSKGEVTCGVNLCPTPYDQLATVTITVKAAAVKATLTWSSTSMGRPTTASLSGTRDGTTAKMQGANQFVWGTITFMDVDPNSAAVSFASADGCQTWGGSFGTQGPEGCY